MAGARDIILHEAFASDGVVMAARVGEDPGPERFEQLHQALQAYFQLSKASTALERDMALALHSLAFHTRTQFEHWHREGKSFRPNLLDQDLPRLCLAVESCLEGRWSTRDSDLG